ncbi:MAG: MFS transporter, partial [Bacteroidota bacterium]
LALFILILFVKIPPIELRSDEKTGRLENYGELIRNPTVLLFFLGIFAYVGCEQGISYWMSKFLAVYHGVDYETLGARVVANFWGLMTLGGCLGLLLLKLLDSKIVLRVFTLCTMLSLLSGLFGAREWSIWALPLTGFFMSVMYPIIFSLGMNSLDKQHGAFAGILVTGIMGGAIVQLLIGGLADWIGLRGAMLVNLLCLAYILSISFWARPLVKNKTLEVLSKEN